MLTVFTPTYNRAYILPKLYESLCQQTSDEYEWLIVDDGSTDDTESIVNGFIEDNIIKIRYFRQENGGKHRAINFGVQKAIGELFLIVDSDDYLTEDAVAQYNKEFASIVSDNSIAGVSFMRCTPDGKKIGSTLPFESKICDAFELTYKCHAKGDMAEAFRTSILKEYQFPDIVGEKFCPEALVWFRIAAKYKMLWVNKCVYVCEYLPDGLTSSITRIRHQSPRYSMLFYAETMHNCRIPFKVRIKNAINFWRFAQSSELSLKDKIRQSGILWFPFFIPGIILAKRDNNG